MEDDTPVMMVDMVSTVVIPAGDTNVHEGLPVGGRSNSDKNHHGRSPRETRAGTALLSIQKETQDRTTISMVGKYVCSMKKKMCLRRMKVMNRRLYQPGREQPQISEAGGTGWVCQNYLIKP